MYEFSVGDRVVSTANHPDGNEDIVVGSTGTVCCITDRIGVRWDEEIEGGHGAEGHCEYGYGWFVDEWQLEPEPDDGVTFEFNEDEFNKLVFGGIGVPL